MVKIKTTTVRHFRTLSEGHWSKKCAGFEIRPGVHKSPSGIHMQQGAEGPVELWTPDSRATSQEH